MSWRDWVRTVEIEPSLYAADFSRLGEQIETLLRAGARVFHFDVGDGHFVPPVTIGPIVLKSISPMILEHEGAIDCHLMVENPERHFEAIREAGGSSVTFHYEACDDPQAIAALAREQGLGVGLAFNPETSPEDAARVADGFDLVLCMSIHPGYSGQKFMPEAIGRVRTLRGLVPPEVFIQVDGGVGPENVARAVSSRARACSSRGRASSAGRICRARIGGWYKRSGVTIARAVELAERGRGRTYPNPLVGAVVVRDGEVVGEGWHERHGGPHAEVNALRAAGDRARGCDAVRVPRAVHASRNDAALRRRDPRSGRRARRRRRARSESRT